MMSDLEIEQVEQSINLYHKLAMREIKKSETDVVYDDLQNWYRNDMLITDQSDGKYSQSKLSYYEYIWLRIVDELNKYGVRYALIKKVKESLIDKSYAKEMMQASDENMDKVKEIDEDAYQGLLLAKQDPSMSNLLEEYLKGISTPLFQIIIYVVVSRLDAVLIVNRLGEFDVVTKMQDEKGNLNYESLYQVKDLRCSAHICIPLSHLIPKYLKVDSIDCCSTPEKPLTDDEHKLLKLIRGKQYGDLKSVTIEYKKGKADILKVTELKKVSLESKLLDHIQKGGYQNISYKTQDGKIAFFSNERVYKI